MEFCSPVWGVAMEILHKIKFGDCRLIKSPIITSKVPTLQYLRDVASSSLFYRYFYDQCSDKLHPVIPHLLVTGRVTRGLESAHKHTLTIPICRTSSFKNSFLLRVNKLWGSLPSLTFSSPYV